MTNEKITNSGRNPESPKLKNTTNREQPGQNEATTLEALYKIYPNMNRAEDNSSRPQPSKKYIYINDNNNNNINKEINYDRKPKTRLLSHNWTL